MIQTIRDLRAAVRTARVGGTSGSPVALVPTMGALHDGHFALVRRARELGDVVVSIFVNPLQFSPTDGLDRYPRSLDADLAALAAAGVEHVFAPSIAEMYPSGAAETRVTAGHIGALYEGASRPGHFDGMLTVVTKLLNIVRPDYAVFGQKDAQQVFLVSRAVRDLNLPVSIEVVPTVREDDGLALSSRNRFLDPGQRRAALALSTALAAAASAAASTVGGGPDAALAAARAVLTGEPAVRLDYLVAVDPHTFLPVDDDYRGEARVLVAALVGPTRLIDNEIITLP